MKCEVRSPKGYPVLYIDNVPQAPILFFGNTDTGNNVTAQARMAGEAGIHLHSAIYNLHFTDGEKPATCRSQDPRARDAITDLQRCLNAILDGDPEGKIFLRVKVGAYFRTPPAEWEDQLIRFANGSIYPEGESSHLCLASTSSDKWADAVDEKLTQIVSYMLSEEKYREHIAAIHLENYEWFEFGFRESGSDCSPVADAKFQAWQRARYGEEYPRVPVPRDLPNNRSRDFYANTLLLNRDEQRYIDYFDFIGDLVSDRIERFARTVKKVSDNQLLVLAFYGYLFELADCQSGHYRMQKLLRSPFLDGFAGPVSYADRTNRAPHGASGATSSYMTVMDSAARHGKLWFQESDQRTSLNGSPDCGWLPNTETVEDLYQIHKREVGDILLHGCGMWAMDLMDTGWLMDPRIWINLKQLADLYVKGIQKDRTHSSFDMVLVIDEAAESIVGQPSFNGLSKSLINEPRFALYRAGVSFAFAEMQDVADGMFRDGKLFIFLNPYRISHKTACALKRELEGKKALWMYGFGETDPEDIRLLTGMKITRRDPGCTQIFPTDDASDRKFVMPGSPYTVTHRYAAEGGVSLGVYDNGSCGFAVSGNSWFYGGTALDPSFIRTLAKHCGIHVYTDENDVFITDGDFAVYCATESGEKRIRLKSNREEVWTAYAGETRYFYLNSTGGTQT